MELIDLAAMQQGLRLVHIIDCAPPAVIHPNEEVLRKLSQSRSRQSATSRRRNNFIGAVTRASAEETQARRLYLEEWYIRISDNESD